MTEGAGIGCNTVCVSAAVNVNELGHFDQKGIRAQMDIVPEVPIGKNVENPCADESRENHPKT